MSSPASPILDQMRARASQLFQSGQAAQAAAAYRGIMEVVPSDFDAIHHLGQLAIQLGHLEEARKLLEGALGLKPDHAEAWLHHGMALQHLGRTDDAVASYQRALGLKPDYAEAAFCIGVTRKDAGQTARAIEAFNACIAMRGDIATAFLHRGDLLRDSGKIDEALADYESALTLSPGFLDAWMHRGVLFVEQGRAEEALPCYERARQMSPGRGDVWYNHGVALQALERDAEALDCYNEAVRLMPAFPDAWNNRGGLLRKAGNNEAALADFERALALDPKHVQALVNRGAALAHLHRFDDALASYDKALAETPEQADLWHKRGAALSGMGRGSEALDAYDRAVAIAPEYAELWTHRGNMLRHMGRFEEALASFQRALTADPRHPASLAALGFCLQDMRRFSEALREFRKLQIAAPQFKTLLDGLTVSGMALCEWALLEELLPRLKSDVTAGKAVVSPFSLLGLVADPQLHRAAAEQYLLDEMGQLPSVAAPAPKSHDKIRIAYVSADFRTHATARLMAGLFESHDRSRFEIIAISFGPDDDSAIAQRVRAGFDQFHDVRKLSDRQAAELMRELDVDIAVDLKGYTGQSRPGIFAWRPAPVQVAYLGYPGTSGMGHMDYIIADAVALPLDQQPYYAEKIVHLPDSYQVNDPKRVIGPTPAREEAGLPVLGAVFACFNNHWKITRPVFESWMRLLAAAPDSVLWLIHDTADDVLVREATARGIARERIIFAPRVENAAHLGRLKLADLVLDTSPYNAHTTGSDALWAGVPLLTVLDSSFAGRVGASLLTAMGLGELIADNLPAYEALALELTQHPKKLAALRKKLAKNRDTSPLFDVGRFTGHIEAAFTAMADRAGRSQSFAIPG